jgi:hypothetical protein
MEGSSGKQLLATAGIRVTVDGAYAACHTLHARTLRALNSFGQRDPLDSVTLGQRDLGQRDPAMSVRAPSYLPACRIASYTTTTVSRSNCFALSDSSL